MGMSTGGGGGNRRRRSRFGQQRPMSEINMTPLVDVMLVLLIIFMVSAPLLTAGVPLELPQAKGTQLETEKQQPVVVSVRSDKQIFLGEEEKQPIAIEELGSKLKVIAGQRKGDDEPIFVRGDKAVDYGTMARVMARIREAGFRKLSLVTETESGG